MSQLGTGLLVTLLVGSSAYSAGTSRAYSELVRSSEFSIARLGRSSTATPAARAFKAMVKKKSKDEFVRLAQEGTSANQLYGLCGLKHLDPAVYSTLREEIGARPTPVTILNGCVVMRGTLAEAFIPFSPAAGGKDTRFDMVCRTLWDYALGRNLKQAMANDLLETGAASR
jgi:hypothetical protein